jgi:hypothetical protein
MRYLFWATTLFIYSCGGSAAQQPSQEASGLESVDSDPSEQLDPQASDDDSMTQSAFAGPASITIEVTVKGEPVSSDIKLLNEANEVVSEGGSGQTFRVRSGRYSAQIQLTDKKALIDKPTKVLEFELAPGAEVTEKVSFPWTQIRLNVKVKGRLNKKAKVKLIRDGEVVATLQSAARDYVIISPGHYQAEVKVGSLVTKLDDIMLPEGATRDVPINVSF